MRRTAEESAGVRQRLIAAAAREFAQLGYERASLRHICAKARTSTGSLYSLFGSKEELFRSVLEPVTGHLLAVLARHHAAELSVDWTSGLSDPVFSVEEDLRAVAAVYDTIEGCPDVRDILLNNRQQPPVRDFFDQVADMLATHMRSLVGREALRETPYVGVDDYLCHWMSHQQIDMIIHLLTHPLDHEEALRELDAMVRFDRGGVFARVARAEHSAVDATGERSEGVVAAVPPGRGARRT